MPRANSRQVPIASSRRERRGRCMNDLAGRSGPKKPYCLKPAVVPGDASRSVAPRPRSGALPARSFGPVRSLGSGSRNSSSDQPGKADGARQREAETTTKQQTLTAGEPFALASGKRRSATKKQGDRHPRSCGPEPEITGSSGAGANEEPDQDQAQGEAAPAAVKSHERKQDQDHPRPRAGI